MKKSDKTKQFFQSESQQALVEPASPSTPPTGATETPQPIPGTAANPVGEPLNDADSDNTTPSKCILRVFTTACASNNTTNSVEPFSITHKSATDESGKSENDNTTLAAESLPLQVTGTFVSIPAAEYDGLQQDHKRIECLKNLPRAFRNQLLTAEGDDFLKALDRQVRSKKG